MTQVKTARKTSYAKQLISRVYFLYFLFYRNANPRKLSCGRVKPSSGGQVRSQDPREVYFSLQDIFYTDMAIAFEF